MAEEITMGGKLAAWPLAVRSYVEDLNAEMRRVTWPHWKQVRATTTVVIISVFAFAAYFYVVDLAVNRLIGSVINFFAK
ncbi:MAG: preprotein translocase subunit SecE [Acidobacteria bacterium]|nr:preprotein translocase subunit SecE [Acidobacteriota bacterium]